MVSMVHEFAENVGQALVFAEWHQSEKSRENGIWSALKFAVQRPG